MRDRSGARRGGARCRRPLRRRHRGEAELLRSTAAWLRADPDRARAAGVACAEDAAALAALLDLLASTLPHLDPAVRREAVASCRAVLDGG